MRFKIFFTSLLFLLLVSFFFLPAVSAAAKKESALDLLKKTGPAAGYSAATTEYSLSAYIGTIIFAFLSLLAVIFLFLTVYAGYLWFTAGGDEKKVDKAKDYLKNGVIGMIIILSAMGITQFIVFRLIPSSSGV